MLLSRANLSHPLWKIEKEQPHAKLSASRLLRQFQVKPREHLERNPAQELRLAFP